MLGSSSAQSDLAVDLHSLNRLRSLSRRDQGEALNQAAKQFEALFIQMMLKNARNASFGDPLFDSNNMDLYQSMFDQQLALNMAETGQTGIGDLLIQQFKDTVQTAPVGQEKAPAQESLSGIRRYLGPTPSVPASNDTRAKDEQISLNVSGKGVHEFESPSHFIETLRPHAEKAAAQLGVSPQVILAQAALETGWGQHVSRDSDGKSSYNLFNIKANGGWSGKTLEMGTLEYIDGRFIKENATFRAYDGYADSFEDYVEFLKSNPRYGDAIAQVNDDTAFAEALQGAGYATDPAYADKITRVLQSSSMAEAFGGLKLSRSGPLTSKDG
ncbi:MAG: flagellar assembly peptidoglycan hydrolase FlgJ [Gammaproteobacteria bacterium]|nr:flagellar assembly peptidoglycan hydrolase FlgJ [Gammaproteobacteria bacterium]